jgi:hypothetical protein
MKKLSFIAMVLIPLIFCSCKKSKEQEYKSWANKTDESFRSAATNWAITNGGINLEANRQILDLADAFGKAVKSDVSKENIVELGEAGGFLLQLHNDNKLPGISKDEHGNLTTDTFSMTVSNNSVGISRPITWTFHLVKDGSASTNNYTVVKQSKDGNWKIQKAWLTDSNGQIIQEWPVK